MRQCWWAEHAGYRLSQHHNLAKKASSISEGPKSPVTSPWYHDAALYLGASSSSLEVLQERISRHGPVARLAG